MNESLKKTPLYDWHRENGATMAGFGGYEMPLWYESAKNEHLSVLTHAGMFDTSHMAVVMVSGSQSLDLLQFCFTQNLNACIGKDKKPLYPGKCVYGAFLNEKGEVIDDSIVYMLAPSRYMVVVNAGMGQAISRHLEAHKGNRVAEIRDLSDQLGKVDIQGPFSAKILAKVLFNPQQVFQAMPYFSFKGSFETALPESSQVLFTDGTPVLLSRSGYTGEFGFELFVPVAVTVGLWERILEAGKDLGLTVCGLAARDSLRASAVLPLSHQDIGHWPFINHPWEFALPFDETKKGFTKDFLGAAALLNLENPEYTYPFVGEDLRKVTVSDPALVMDGEGKPIGTVLTCVTDMGMGLHNGRIFCISSPDKPESIPAKGLSCGFIKVNRKLDYGQVVVLRDKRRTLKVRIVENIRPGRTARRPIQEML